MRAFYEMRNNNILLSKTQKITFPTHFHPAVEVIVITKGKTQCIVDDVSYEVLEGEAVIVFPNQIHSYTDKGDVLGAEIIFESSVVPEFKKVFKELTPSSPIVKRETLEKNGFHKILQTVLAEYENASQQIQKGWLLVLMGKLFEGCQLIKRSSSSTDITADILNYCESNYHDDMSLKTTAKALHISESRLSHIFSEKIKMSFNNYINMIRINEAANLLIGSEKSIAEIAGICGFSSIRTFNRAFLRQMGTSPMKFRKTVDFLGEKF